MKKILMTLFFLFLTINLNAQKSDIIIGKWVFTKALNKEVDKAGLEYMNAEVIGKWKFDFKSDGKFETSTMGEKASGTWKLGPSSNSIILMGIDGGPQEFEILKSTKNELVLKLGLGEFLLTKINH